MGCGAGGVRIATPARGLVRNDRVLTWGTKLVKYL